MELKFEEVVRPPRESNPGRPRKYPGLTENIDQAPVGVWVKVSGFESEEEAYKASRSVRSGKRCIANKLLGKGISLKVVCLKDEKTMFFIKNRIEVANGTPHVQS